MIEIIYQLILTIPTDVEIFGDRKGDPHTNRKDFLVRCMLIVGCAFVVAFIHGLMEQSFPIMWEYFPKCLALSIGYFVGFFNYGVNIIQRRITEDYRWFDHLSDNPNVFPDNNKLWRRIGWKWRMVVSLGLFAASLIYYIYG